MTSVSGWAVNRFDPDTYRAHAQPTRVAWPQRQADLWREAVRDAQITQIASLPDDWDGSGAAAVDALTIAHARSLLAQLLLRSAEPDFIAPTNAGTITFEWERPLGEAHLEIGRDNFGFYTAPRQAAPVLLSGSVEELDGGEIFFALAAITSGLIPHSLADRDVALGIAIWDEEGSESSGG
jgi:hypothetical protein